MLRNFTLLVLCTVTCTTLFAQSPSFQKGQSTISAGYGVFSTYKRLFNFTTPINDDSYDVSSTGPYALIYEYGFTPRISAGIAVGYSKTTGVYKYQSFVNTEKLVNYSMMLRGNYHFGKMKNFDPYVGFGLGYLKFDYESKDNSGTSNPGTVKVPGGFGYSGILGGKYYFTPAVGAFSEVGYIGGSYAQLGLTFKF